MVKILIILITKSRLSDGSGPRFLSVSRNRILCVTFVKLRCKPEGVAVRSQHHTKISCFHQLLAMLSNRLLSLDSQLTVSVDKCSSVKTRSLTTCASSTEHADT